MVAVIAVALLPSSSYSTSILIIGTGSVLYLAADSLQTDPSTGHYRHYCKIRNSGDLYWAASTDFYIHPATRFDLEKLVASVGTRGSVQDILERFIKVAVRPLKREIATIKTEDPAAYRRYIAGAIPLYIGFVRLEKGSNGFAIVKFVTSEVEGIIRIKPERIPREPATARNPRVYGIGASDAAYEYLTRDYQQFSKNPVAAIRGALQTDHIAHPKDVDGPYSILRLDGTTAQWEDQGQCQ
jgi:hypothetical protein